MLGGGWGSYPFLYSFSWWFHCKAKALQLQKRVLVKLTEQNPNNNKTLEEDRRPENLLTVESRQIIHNSVNCEDVLSRSAKTGLAK
jgi:hypothetical protein